MAHQVVAVAEEHGVAIATERLKYLRKSKRGDGSGRHFRRKQHRFAYRVPAWRRSTPSPESGAWRSWR
jgi:hypothetical protein